MNPLNTQFNKASWSGAINAAIILANKYALNGMMDATDQGLVLLIATAVVVTLVPNAKAPE